MISANLNRDSTYNDQHPMLPGSYHFVIAVWKGKERQSKWRTQQDSQCMPTKRKFPYSIYVVLLNPDVVNVPQIKRRNPKRDPLKPCVYVGLTGLRVDRCFDYRRPGAIPDTWPSHKYGIRLMPELYEHLNPMPYEKALQMARKLAADLRVEGYTVTNGVSANAQQYPAVKAALDFYA